MPHMHGSEPRLVSARQLWGIYFDIEQFSIIQHSIGTAVHWADGLHGRMGQNGFLPGQAHISQVLQKVQFGIAH